MQTSFYSDLRYTNNNNLSLRDFAQALMAYERIANNLPKLLEAISDEIEIDKLAISLDSLERNSTHNFFLLELALKIQKSLEDAIQKRAEKVGSEFLENHKETLSQVIMCVILYGGWCAFDAVHEDKTPPNISHNY